MFSPYIFLLVIFRQYWYFVAIKSRDIQGNYGGEHLIFTSTTELNLRIAHTLDIEE